VLNAEKLIDAKLAKLREADEPRLAPPSAAHGGGGSCANETLWETAKTTATRSFACRRKHDGDALTRDEDLAWCKRRALEYVDAGDLTRAVASMASDLKTHPDTDNLALNGLAMIGMMYVTDGDKAAVQRWIERFR
jgi:hypothetical protein